MHDQLIYEILSWIQTDYDYSSLILDTKPLQILLRTAYQSKQRAIFCDVIEEHFSRLFYLHVMVGPPCRNAIDDLFTELDPMYSFQSPFYYDLATYMKLFDEFDTYALSYYAANGTISNNSNNSHITHHTPRQKIYRRFRVSLINALTLC